MFAYIQKLQRLSVYVNVEKWNEELVGRPMARHGKCEIVKTSCIAILP